MMHHGPVRVSWILVLVFSLCGILQAQQTAGALPAPGLDPLLHNGQVYQYHPPPGTTGHPFLNGPDGVKGSIRLRGEIFQPVRIKYDVFNQDLVLLYDGLQGGVQQISVSRRWLESFMIEKSTFMLFPMANGESAIYQVIGHPGLRVLYAWSKELVLDNRVGERHFMFPAAKRKCFLQRNGSLLPYSSNKTFLSCFDKTLQPQIRKFLKEKKIRLQQSTDESVERLMDYCTLLMAS